MNSNYPFIWNVYASNNYTVYYKIILVDKSITKYKYSILQNKVTAFYGNFQKPYRYSIIKCKC